MEENIFAEFKNDICINFGKSVAEATATWNSLNSILDGNDDHQIETKMVEYVQMAFEDAAIIPVFVVDGIRKTKISVLGYAVLLFGIYLRYDKHGGNRSSSVLCTLNECPFTRVLVDCDIDDDRCCLADGQCVDIITDIIGSSAKLTKFVLTKRFNTNTRNFHLVYEQQFDPLTARHILQRIIECVAADERCGGIRIDHIHTWAFPSGRCHTVNGMPKMTWKEFRSIAPIDIWTKNNFYSSLSNNSLISNYGISVEHGSTEAHMNAVSFNTEYECIFVYDGTNAYELFFRKFLNYSSFQYGNVSFTMAQLLGFSPNGRSRSPDDIAQIVELIEADVEEFYNIFYTSKISYAAPLASILSVDIEDLNIPRTFDDIDECMKLIETDRQTASEYERYIGYVLHQIGQCRCDEDNKRMQIIEEHASRFLQFDVCLERLLHLINEEDENILHITIYLYSLYCVKHSRDLSCSNAFRDNFFSYFENLFLSAEQRQSNFLFGKGINFMRIPDAVDVCSKLKQNSAENNFVPDLICVFRDIIAMMLNNCHITSVLSMFLSYALFKRDPLVCIIIALNTLPISLQTKFILMSYITGLVEPYITSVTKAIVQCFCGRFPFVYFLTGFFNMDIDESWEKWLELFGVDSFAYKPCNKRARKANFSDNNNIRLLTCFNKYVAHLYRNNCYYFIYANNRFCDYDAKNQPKKFLDVAYACSVSVEPSHFAYWYRREPGIYFSITGIHEHHSPSLFSMISIRTPDELRPLSYSAFNYFNYDIKSFMLNALLKARHFIDMCNLNKTMAVVLGSIYPSMAKKRLEYYFDMVQIVPFDLNDVSMKLPDNIREMIAGQNDLCNMLIHLYVLVCTMSYRCDIDLRNPAKFIDDIMTLATENSHIPRVANTTGDRDDDLLGNGSCSANESLFIRYIREACERYKFIDLSSAERQKSVVKLCELRFNRIKQMSEQNVFLLREYLDGSFRASEFQSFDINDVEADVFVYTFFVLSWTIRLNEYASLSELTYFQHLYGKQTLLYSQLCNVMISTCGSFIRQSDIRHLAAYFKKFCQNSYLEIPDANRIQSPPGYASVHQINNYANCDDESLTADIYVGIAGLVLNSQFSVDTFIDLAKILSSFTHRGNTKREALAFLNRSATGKNVLIEFILRLFKTDYQQEFKFDNLQNCDKDTGNILTRPLNSNLVVWFDEVLHLDNNFKLITNFGTLNERLFKLQQRGEFRINSHIIISANSDPSSMDIATQTRVMPIDRKMQFVDLAENRRFDRTNSVADTTLGVINNFLAAQLLLEKLPSGGELGVDIAGIYLLTWLCSDIFLYKFSLPVSQKKSKTMHERMARFIYSAQPAKYILDSRMITFSASHCMDLEDFDVQALNKLKQCKALLSSNVKTHVAIKELKDQLSKYIHGRKIYVTFN